MKMNEFIHNRFMRKREISKKIKTVPLVKLSIHHIKTQPLIKVKRGAILEIPGNFRTVEYVNHEKKF